MYLKDSEPGSSEFRPLGVEAIMAEQCTAHGLNGVSVAASPRAAVAGANVLQSGGNAYAAALANALAETVLLPPKCGLAGDLIALAWEPNSSDPETLLAIGGAPNGLADIASNHKLTATGATSVGVPGAPSGYLALADRANIDLAELAAPAIELARHGFCWSRICSVLAEESHALVADLNRSHTRFYPNGVPIAPGTATKLPGMANALEAFVAERENFLTGKVGHAIISRVQAAGGILTLDDMQYSRAQWTACKHVDPFPGTRVYATPEPTHGASLLEAIQSVFSRGTNPSAGQVHADIMRVIATRRAQLADPSGTSMVSAIDDNGCMVTIIHSLSYPRFGSGLIVDEYDLILGNRAGRGFTAIPGHPNFPAAGKRPASTLHAWALELAPGERLLGATPGGANQMPWNTQSLVQLISDKAEADIGRVICAPRWQWVTEDDSLVIEEGLAPSEYSSLTEGKTRFQDTPLWGLRSAMQILQTSSITSSLRASVDPRTGGAVIAL